MGAPARFPAARFSAALAEGRDWSDVAKACLQRLDPVPGANLGFLYVSDALADQIGSIATLFRGVTGVDFWVGTAGMGVCGPAFAADGTATLTEAFDRPAIAAMLGTFPADAVQALPQLTDALAPLDRIAGWLDRVAGGFAPPTGLVHVDPRSAHGIGLVTALAERTGAFLLGGLTASRGEFPQLAGKVTTGGLSGVLFDPSVGVVTALTQGCSPIGPARTVTAAEDNVIMEIDGRPALEFFRQDIGEVLARDMRRVAGYIFAALPVAGTDTGDYLVRNLVGIDLARGWIAIAEKVEPGRPILFTRRDRAAAEADLNRMLDQILRRLPGPPAEVVKGGLYVSCVARGPNLFGGEGAEIGLIRDRLGEVPLVGFFANGEISHNRLYGYTGVLTLFV